MIRFRESIYFHSELLSFRDEQENDLNRERQTKEFVKINLKFFTLKIAIFKQILFVFLQYSHLTLNIFLQTLKTSSFVRFAQRKQMFSYRDSKT